MPSTNKHRRWVCRAAAAALVKPKPKAKKLNNNVGVQGMKNEKHDVGTSSVHEYGSTSESEAATTYADDPVGPSALIPTDACKVFDEKPDSDIVEQPNQPHWTCYAKLHTVPIQGNKLKLDANHLDTSWRFCLVGHRFEKSSFCDKQELLRLCSFWNVPCKPFHHPTTGWFVFKFEKEQHREQVLLGGPYTLSGRNLFLKRMPPFFEFDSDPKASIPLWIKLPGLPLECWSPTALSMIASAVGKPIGTDKDTQTKERISHARLLVEVDGCAEARRVSSIEIQLPNGVVRQQSIEFDVSVLKYESKLH